MAELQPPEGQVNGGAPAGTSSEAVVTKRQRRPSVRLGEIGEPAATLACESHARRSKQWHDYKHKKEPGGGAAAAAAGGKSSKTRTLMNLAAGEFQETLEVEEKEGNGDGVAIGSWKVKDLKSRRAPAKRIRSNWLPKVDDGGGDGDEKFSGGDGEDVDDGFREFEPEGSDSPMKEQSPVHSLDNMAVDLRQSSERGLGNELHFQRRPFRARVSEGREENANEFEGPSDTEARDWKCGTSADMNANGGRGRCQSSEDGVRIWLDGLGLGRYAPVFEIHEVDDEVLPMLTLEDLKDMGINAVGSRRKIFCAIQKLGKGFS